MPKSLGSEVMNEYKTAWLHECGQLSQNIIDEAKEVYNEIKESVIDWHNLSPTDPKRLIAHMSMIPIAVGADALASGVLLTYAGPGILAGMASMVVVGAMFYFVYSAYQLYGPFLVEFVRQGDWSFLGYE